MEGLSIPSWPNGVTLLPGAAFGSGCVVRMGRISVYQWSSLCITLRSTERKQQDIHVFGSHLEQYSICHQPNCRFDADKNAPHLCLLTWALATVCCKSIGWIVGLVGLQSRTAQAGYIGTARKIRS